MSVKRNPFNRRIGKNAAGTLDTLDDYKVPGGWRRCYQRFGVLDANTAYTKLRFVEGGVDPGFIVSEDQAPQADEFVWDDQEIWLRSGQFLQAILTGATSGDDISLHVIGYDVLIGEGD